MLQNSAAFSGFTVKDIAAAKEFYSTTLGLKLTESKEGLQLIFPNGHHVFIYEKPDHQPATFTILNFIVTDIDNTIDGLTKNGVVFERYDTLPAPQDEKAVLRGRAVNMGPDIAWFKDPSGNILSVLQE